jgi:endonuclease YncB( thermonuclease family)
MFRPRFLSAALFIALCVLIAAALNKRNEEMIVGGARAIDGDSLVVLGREMRLKGLDAPEARQLCSLAGQSIPCGRQAMQALQRWLARGPVTCIGHETDRYGRLLVTCRVNGADIGADLVRNGAAVAFGSYAAEEREARAAYRGVWGGEFERPEDYRRRMRDEKQADKASQLPEKPRP